MEEERWIEGVWGK